MYDVKLLALLGAPYIYDISRLRVKLQMPVNTPEESIQHSKTFSESIAFVFMAELNSGTPLFLYPTTPVTSQNTLI
jgi:hypothetical protein